MLARLVFSVALGLVSLPALADSSIYKWVDAEGRVHFTQDLGQVPQAHRREAQLSRHRVRTRDVQLYESQVPAKAGRTRSRIASSGRALEIPFELRGSAMFVYVKLNDQVTAPFIVDTGATDVAVPAHVAKKAGIHVTSDTPRATYQTANGRVDKPIIHLDAVQVGEVRVEGVRGSVSEQMDIGLLGGTFFNNFTFQIDPAAQIITLIPNPHVRGGIPEKQWRLRFSKAHGRLTALSEYIDGNVFIDKGRVRELEAKRSEFEQAIAALEEEADLADVPQAWRTGE